MEGPSNHGEVKSKKTSSRMGGVGRIPYTPVQSPGTRTGVVESATVKGG